MHSTLEILTKAVFCGEAPWICCGDFNEILDDFEKLEGREKLQSGIDNFRQFIEICQLHDLGFKGAIALLGLMGMFLKDWIDSLGAMVGSRRFWITW